MQMKLPRKVRESASAGERILLFCSWSVIRTFFSSLVAHPSLKDPRTSHPKKIYVWCPSRTWWSKIATSYIHSGVIWLWKLVLLITCRAMSAYYDPATRVKSLIFGCCSLCNGDASHDLWPTIRSLFLHDFILFLSLLLNFANYNCLHNFFT